MLRPLALLVLFVAVIRGLPGTVPSSSSGIDCNMATIDVAAGRPALERCLELHPEDVELLMEVGRAFAAEAQWERAEAVFRRALESDPDDGDAHLWLGEALLHRGDTAGALREGTAALKIQPGSPAAQSLIARAQAGGSGTAR